MKALKYLSICLIFMTILYIPFFPLNYGSYFPACLGVFILLFGYFKEKNKIIFVIMKICLIYFSITFSIFLFLTLKSNFIDKDANYDVFIVLGAGLNKDSSISNTLKSRLDKCVEVTTNNDLMIVVSGGQGDDEPISEASAMKNYLVQNGVSSDRIFLEDKSTNTEENFLFGKKIIDNEIGLYDNIAYITNNFHIVRSGVYMRKAGLQGFGISSSTPFYMIPSCFLRDYVALNKLIVFG